MAIDLTKYKLPAQGVLDVSKYKTAATGAPAVTPATSQGLFQKIWSSVVTQPIQARGERMNALYEGREGSQNPTVRGLQTAAQPFGAVVDIAGGLLTKVLPEIPAFQKVATAIPESVTVKNPETGASELYNPVERLFKASGNITPLQDAFIRLEKENPDLGEAIYQLAEAGQAGGEIADAIGLAHGLQQAGRYVDKKISQTAPVVAKKTQELYRTVTARSEQAIEKNIIYQYEKGVKPNLPGKTTTAQQARYKEQVVEGVQTINKNKANLQYVDDTGELVKGQSPQSVQQLNDSIAQTKKVVFEQYNAEAVKAGEAGLRVSTRPIADELDTIINNKSLQLSNPSAIKYAEAFKARLQAAETLDPIAMQDFIQNLNQSLQAFYRNPTYGTATRAQIDALIANKARLALDEGVNSFTGSQYQPLRNQYSALKAMERDVAKAALREARKNIKGLIDYSDILSGGQVVNGILSLNPATIGQGLAQKAIAEFYKFLNDPNRAIQRMFKYVDDLEGAPKVNPVVDYVKNVQPGLSVNNVADDFSTLHSTPEAISRNVLKQAIMQAERQGEPIIAQALKRINPKSIQTADDAIQAMLGIPGAEKSMTVINHAGTMQAMFQEYGLEMGRRNFKFLDEMIKRVRPNQGASVASVPIRGEKGQFKGRTAAAPTTKEALSYQKEYVRSEITKLVKEDYASVKGNLITHADDIDELEEILRKIKEGVADADDIRTGTELLQLLKS